jgi:arylsulfatase A-like enzyme
MNASYSGKALAIFSTMLTIATAMAAAGAEARHPNIVYLVADQWRAQAAGYAGDPNVHTPNLDRLARDGVQFRNAVSVCPVCTPYRSALMTGRYPTSTGMFLNDAYLPEAELCMAEIFKAAGYSTGYIGKWHLDGHGRESFIPPERRQGGEYWKAAECDHNYDQSHYYMGDSPEKHYWEGYDAFAETKDAQQYIREHATSWQPFVLVVAYGVPHFPHGLAPAEYKAMYPPEKIKLPPNVPEGLRSRARQEAQGYYAHCTALDKCIGDVLATLAETGLEKNTIVVFTSDHGEMLGAHGCPPTMKQVPWNESAHVPFLLRYPAGRAADGRMVGTPITTPDILPTLMGLAGIRGGGRGRGAGIQGEDLSGLVRHGQEHANRAALYMEVAPFGPREFLREYRAIRTSRYTYVRDLNGPWLLFDDENDRYQMDNLARKPEYRRLQKELDGRLQAELKKIGDDFRPARAYIAEWGYKVAPYGSVPYTPNAMMQSPKRHSPAQ